MLFFFTWAKHIIGNFWTFFEVVPKIALHYAQDSLGLKKVSAPSKNLSNWPIIYFARKNIPPPHFKNQRYITSYFIM
jgi:hypothetical protein